MRLHRYNRNQDDSISELIPETTSDASTTDYNFGKVSNVEIDESGCMTVYSEEGHWYITMTASEFLLIQKLIQFV